MKSTQPKRSWVDARLKVERQGRCLVCGDEWRRFPGRRLEAAHTAGRQYDQPKPCPVCHGDGELHEAIAAIVGLDDYTCPLCHGYGSEDPTTLWVNPDDIAVLCGPSTDTATCHGLEHAHRLDLIRFLNLREQQRVVEHLGGIALAYGHLTFDEQSAAA